MPHTNYTLHQDWADGVCTSVTAGVCLKDKEGRRAPLSSRHFPVDLADPHREEKRGGEGEVESR